MTRVTTHVDGSITRVTNYDFDWGNLQTYAQGEEDHEEVMTHDNLDRVVRV